MKTFRKLLRSNLLKSLLFNFKMLPFRQAVRLPILFYGKTNFRSLKGAVEIKGRINTGMITVGRQDVYVDTSVQNNIWTINGTIVFDGPVRFFRGSYVLVAKDAVLEINSRPGELGLTKIGSNTKIMCFEHIKIGYACRIAWECQIYDTSFHYLEYTESPQTDIVPLSEPIIIGDFVWIGNRTTISKGAVIPDNSVVASNTLVNNDFSEQGPCCMLAGIPASLKVSGVRRVYDRKYEKELDQKFGYSRTGL